MTTERSAGALGDMVRQERRQRGLTLAELGRAVGLSMSYISDIERGNRAPTTDTVLSALAAGLDVDPDGIYYAAGRIPPDLRNLDVTSDDIRRAFAVFRAILRGNSPDPAREGA